ncbi:MAG: hypothetical protein Q9182_002555 [Xanthomendoza sp. 2 TL-2023]
MPSPYSPYSVEQAEPPKWRPGEEVAASAIIGMTLLLVIEVNFEIFRLFKRRKGLYYWAMTTGSWACGFDAIGIIIKYLSPGTKRVWPIYTLLLSVGWAAYTVAQLTVLYSRLHLVCEGQRLQRGILFMILTFSPIIIITDWVVIWPAYVPNQRITSEWSPRAAIVERCAQLAFSIMEVIISGIYLYCLARLLQAKPSVRQRRVMLDLLNVLLLVVSLDIINIILVFVNRIGLSHPIQTFSYTLKFRLEFLVLNQLMAVAARGLQRETFGERRYHESGALQDPSTFGQTLQTLDTTEHNNEDHSLQRKSPGPIKLPASTLSPTTDKSSFPQRHDSMKGSPRHRGGHWLPTLHNSGKHRLPSQGKPLPEFPQSDMKTFWKDDGDDHEEEEVPIGLENWDPRGSTTLQVPWLQGKCEV